MQRYTKVLVCVLGLCFALATQAGATNVCGNITTNTTWTLAGSPYVLTCNVGVTGSATLIIDPGVQVRGQSGCGLDVDKTAALVANGTSGQPIVFTSDNGSPGGWAGILFNGQGGTPPASSMTYCIVEKAGAGHWVPNVGSESSNLGVYYYCSLTISNCAFQNSSNQGVWLVGCGTPTLPSPTLASCSLLQNGTQGLYLSGASPAITGCQINSNGTYGIYGESDSNPAISSGTNISANTSNPARIGINSTISADCTISGAGAIEYWGGSTTADSRAWHKYACPYRLLGNVTVTNGATLTVDPGAQVRSQSGCGLYVDKTAALVANGTSGQPIVFTSDSGSSGGWAGILFNGEGGTPPASSLSYCTIEKAGAGHYFPSYGNEYSNLGIYYYCNLTINNCTFQNSSNQGLWLVGCSPTLASCSFLQNGTQGLYLTGASPSVTGCQFNSNGTYGIYGDTTCCPAISSGTTISANTSNPARIGINSTISGDCTISGAGAIEYWGGSTTASSRTWHRYACPYRLLGSVTVTNSATLTVDPGVHVQSQSGVALDVDKTAALVANGTSGQPIVFTSDNGSSGGWAGILFNGQGGTPPASSLAYCTIEKAGAAHWYLVDGYWSIEYLNLGVYYYCNLTISNCIFQNSSTKGLWLVGCSPGLTNCSFLQNGTEGLYLSTASPGVTSCQINSNGTYGIYCDSGTSNPVISASTICDNGSNPMRVGLNTVIDIGVTVCGPGCIEYYGGSTSASTRTWYKHAGVQYRILGDVVVRNRCALKIEAGNTVRFASGSGLFVGQYSAIDPNDRGTLTASGTQAEPIIFTADNGTSGGWRGIVFDARFDTAAGRTPPTSTMAWCTVEKGGQSVWYDGNYSSQNVAFYYHSKVVMQNCALTDSTGDGLRLVASSPTASSDLVGNFFSGNASDGIHASSSSPGVTDCTMADNGAYGLYCESSDCNPVICSCTFAGNTTAPMRIGLNSVLCVQPDCDCTISGNGAIEIHPGTTNASDRRWFKWAPVGRKYPGDYSLLGTVTVANGATVTIDPGAVVTSSAQLIVGRNAASDPTNKGALSAVGTETEPIVFTSTNGLVGGWNGLFFEGRGYWPAMTSLLTYCVVDKGGLSSSAMVEGYTHNAMSLSHCTVVRGNGTGVRLTSSNWGITNCIFALNNGYGVQCSGSSPTITCSDAWGNTSADWDTCATGTGCIQLDPLFWSSVDYRLQDTSPCCACGGSYMGAYPCAPRPPGMGGAPYAKSLPDGSEVELLSREVTAGTEDLSECAYVEEDSRCSGLKIRKNVTFAAWEQDVVDITGIMRTSGCERYLDALTVDYVTWDDPVAPLFMCNRSIGGPNAVAFTSQGSFAPGASPGLSNIGLLVETFGKVTQVDTGRTWFFIDDGSGRVGAGANRGVKVSLASLASGNVITPPYVGAYVSVAGISTIEQVGSETYSVIRPRTQNDIEYR